MKVDNEGKASGGIIKDSERLKARERAARKDEDGDIALIQEHRTYGFIAVSSGDGMADIWGIGANLIEGERTPRTPARTNTASTR